MIKSELIESIAKRHSHLSDKDIAASISTIIDQMSVELSSGGRIEVRGFGSFCLHYRPPRNAHNPKTGQRLVTKPKFATHFKPGKELRDRVNANQAIPIHEDHIYDDRDDEE